MGIEKGEGGPADRDLLCPWQAGLLRPTVVYTLYLFDCVVWRPNQGISQSVCSLLRP